MIDFKNGVLTIDTSLSVADSQAISAFADTVRNGEIERIIKLLEENLESWEEGIVFRKGYNIANVPSLIALIKGEK